MSDVVWYSSFSFWLTNLLEMVIFRSIHGKKCFSKASCKAALIVLPQHKALWWIPLSPRGKKKSVIFMAFGYLSRPHFLQLPPHSLAAALWPSSWSSTRCTQVHLRAFASAGPCLQFSRSRPWHGSHVHCTVDMYIDTATCTLHKLLLHITSGRSLSWLPCSDCSLQSPFSVF